MIKEIAIVSLMETAIYISMSEGMIFERLRVFLCNTLDKMGAPYLRKPLCECLTCMGGVYTLVIYPLLFGLSWHVVPVMVAVIGLNTIIAKFLHYGENL